MNTLNPADPVRNREFPLAPLAALVLAAGGASRFAAPKALAKFAGKPLVMRAIEVVRPHAVAGVVVVTGAEAPPVEAVVRPLGVAVVHNAGWGSGIAGSLRVGVGALPPGAAGVIVMLADLPAVTADDIGRLVAAWRVRPTALCCATFDGGIGPPAIFPSDRWSALGALAGDRGARPLLMADADRIEVSMPAAGLDVDTPADLDRLVRSSYSN